MRFALLDENHLDVMHVGITGTWYSAKLWLMARP